MKLLSNKVIIFSLIFFLISCSTGSNNGGEGSDNNTDSGVELEKNISFTFIKSKDLSFGNLWCIPVYDGSNLIISTEMDGKIYFASLDLDMNIVSGPQMIASKNDTANNDKIADHKHIFQDGNHFITFSTSGSGSGGNLYLIKLDTNFNRKTIVNVVENDPPTNDMFLVGDGSNIFVGKYLPGNGHKVYKYNSDLVFQEEYIIGGGANIHGNGASAVFVEGRFHLVAPDNLAPGQNDNFYRIIFDSKWNVIDNKKQILNDPGMIGIVSGLSFESNSEKFIIHYTRSRDDTGGPLYRAIYSSIWDRKSNEEIIDGNFHRPHSVIVGDKIFIGYDSSDLSIHIASYSFKVN